jgi:23S rRNA pseudouridine1911/1915/1917 synthase
MDIPIVYEDKNVVMVNKPAGLSVHGDGFTEECTLVNWILEKYPEIKDVGEDMISQLGKTIVRPGIVHRLDRDTSGVLLIVKTQESFLFFKKAFQEHAIKKTYQSFVYGVVQNNEGVIDMPIGRSKKDPRMRVAWAKEAHQVGKKIRDAITLYKVIKRGKEASFLELYPKTGRTHQLRVHLRAIGHPIIADKLYAGERPPLFGLNRQALHAHALSFTLPSGERLEITADLPKDLQSALVLLG